jgi:hypothetical protein
MLRVESATGWWLVTHPDHARLAGEFASRWGNDHFAAPEPRASVLHGIHVHDDGWAARDARPSITREGKPSAFSQELVGKYSAFEEIDLAAYLAVRESALDQVEARDRYAALLVSMHTYNLLTERADRATIVPEQLPLLDAFLARQRARQDLLRETIRTDSRYTPSEVADEIICDNFRLLQATDNLSLLSCVGFMRPATLLHPLRTNNGGSEEIAVYPAGLRKFRLEPYPFAEPMWKCTVRARHVEGHVFGSNEEFAEKSALAKVEELEIDISG